MNDAYIHLIRAFLCISLIGLATNVVAVAIAAAFLTQISVDSTPVFVVCKCVFVPLRATHDL